MDNVTPIRAEVPEHAPAAIARAFADRFPTVTLEDFRAQRKGAPFVVSSQWVKISGEESELVRLGFLQGHMVPPGRKRILSGRFGTHEGRGSTYYIRKLKGRRLAANFQIMGGDQDCDYYPQGTYVDDLPGDHPMQMCHPRHWPFGEGAERRTVCPCYSTAHEWKSRHKRCLRVALINADRFRYSKPGEDELRDEIYGRRFRFSERDIQRFTSIITKFREELFTAIDQAAAIDTEQPTRPAHLRLIVDNERRSNEVGYR